MPASARTSSTVTPAQLVSNLLHLVTQWMSRWNFVRGSALNSSQVQVFTGRGPTFRVKRHWSWLMRGVGPAERTGKPRSRYWPGGRRFASSSERRRPKKPRVTIDLLLFRWREPLFLDPHTDNGPAIKKASPPRPDTLAAGRCVGGSPLGPDRRSRRGRHDWRDPGSPLPSRPAWRLPAMRGRRADGDSARASRTVLRSGGGRRRGPPVVPCRRDHGRDATTGARGAPVLRRRRAADRCAQRAALAGGRRRRRGSQLVSRIRSTNPRLAATAGGSRAASA